MKKVFAVLCMTAFFVVAVSSPVFAASSQCLFSPDNFELTSVKVSADNCSSWVAPTSYEFTTNDNGSGHFWVNTNGCSFSYFTHWRASFEPLAGAGDLVISSGMNLTATFYYLHYAGGAYHNQTITGALYLTAPDGTIYEFPVTEQSSSSDQSYLFVSVGGTVGVVEPFRFQDCTVEFMFSGITALTGVTLDFNQFNLTVREPIGEETAKVVETIEKGFAELQEQQKDNTQDIIDNQNQNTQDIIDNNNANADKITGSIDESADQISGSIEESTDQITDGWDTNDNTSSGLDDITGDMEDAENAALGGKTDEEIQAEVDGVLSNDNIPDVDHTGVIGVAGLFDKTLAVFGQDYQSLLVLSLTLGFAAFLVGRQYRARGD